MTEVHNSYIVVLKKDMREDDSEHLLNAIRMFKNVLSVVPNVGQGFDVVAEMRVKRELQDKIYEALK